VSAVASPRRRPIVIALVIAVALALAACGAEEEPTDEITIAVTAQPDSLDPALAFDVAGLESVWLAYTPLLTYRRDEGEKGAELIPGLASDLPEISDDGRTYTLRLRKGLLYSDGTEVRASDFEHAIKRVLTLDSGGAPFYEGIDGAAAYEHGGDPNADISGIEADDETGEITIRLTEPDATFANALALTFAAPVPPSAPFRDLTADPPPGVGPYEIAESNPGNQFVLAQSPNFADLDIPDIPTGNLPRITARVIGSVAAQTQEVLDNELDYMQDPPPPDLMPTVIQRAAGRYIEHTTPSTYYFFLNQRRPPFDDPLVREAANWAVDRRALAGLYGGAMEPGCSLLAPGVPGYDERLDTVACPYGFADRDLGRARALIHRAGAAGEPVTVWGSRAADSRAATAAYAATLEQIGLDARTRLVAADRYRGVISDRRTNAQTGFDTWFEDFPHPLDFFVVVDGDSIQPANNPNPGNVDDPLINSEIDRLRRVDDLNSVTSDWSRLDRYVVSPPDRKSTRLNSSH